MSQCVFNYTDTFMKTFDMVVDHLLFYNDQNTLVIEQAEQAVIKVKQVIEQHPQAYPINQDIIEYGLTYREANIPRNNSGLRVLYSIDKTADGYQINFELFLLQKMSVQKTLSQLLLI
jgi:hypothetical protein